jgi:hypothetical protein
MKLSIHTRFKGGEREDRADFWRAQDVFEVIPRE